MNKKTMILLAFGFSGVSALIYEVTWTRALSLVLGSTTYALSTMLSTFMAGLAAGSYIGGKVADKRKDLIGLFGACEGGIGVFGLITVPLIYSLPPFYMYLFRVFHLTPSIFYALQFLICSVIMLVPTTLMGITFPLVSRSLTLTVDEMGRKVGNAYSMNTLGAIVGSFLAGFVLIPVFGIKTATFIAAFINLIVAVVMIWFFSGWRKVLFIFGTFFLLSGAAAAYSEEKITFITFYTAQRFLNIPLHFLEEGDRASYYTTLFHKEYPDGAVRLYLDRKGDFVLQTGGKIEGSTSNDTANTLLLAYLPLASHRNPEHFLVVGLGLGITLTAAKEHVRDVDLIEINPGVLEAARTFVDEGLLDGVKVHINDARQHLLLFDKKYDVISSEPSYPTEAAVANLFTKEFYQLAKERLNPGGIYCQWLPYYFIGDDGVTMMLKTFGSEFRHVYLWRVGDSMDRIMIGSDEPFPFTKEEVMERLQLLNKRGYALDVTVSQEPRQVAGIVRMDEVPLNTDDKPLLEFSTVRNVVMGAWQ